MEGHERGRHLRSKEMSPKSVCWCGNKHFAPFSGDYLQCRDCDTLVSKTGLTTEELEVGIDESAFYGKEYWLSGMAGEGKGFADIFERSRGELVERNLYWCKTILSLKPPPARILELGCSHGGLLALLTAAGYDATGIELSPWVCEFATTTFGVRVLRGPVEGHHLAAGAFDVIALMDVLEHLPDPVSTMQECCRLLKPDGFVLVQTPRHVPGRSFGNCKKTNIHFCACFFRRSTSICLLRTRSENFLVNLGWDVSSFCRPSSRSTTCTSRPAGPNWPFARSPISKLHF